MSDVHKLKYRVVLDLKGGGRMLALSTDDREWAFEVANEYIVKGCYKSVSIEKLEYTTIYYKTKED